MNNKFNNKVCSKIKLKKKGSYNNNKCKEISFKLIKNNNNCNNNKFNNNNRNR